MRYKFFKHKNRKDSETKIYLYLLLDIHQMGCVASDAGHPSKSLHASKHAIDNSLTPDMK